MTRVAEIADYLLAADFDAPEAALKAELIEGILARWPDVTRHDLEAGFEIAALESAARLADAVADQCDRTAIAIARATAANATPT
jgi:hypothetical protein